MGKKRIISKPGEDTSGSAGQKTSAHGKKSKKGFAHGILHIESTYNNTRLLLTDPKGNAVATSSSGSMGFTGARKGTPFAASKVAEALSARAEELGVQGVEVFIKGVGAGRESALRTFANKIEVTAIRDITPVPFNGPRPKKPRRV